MGKTDFGISDLSKIVGIAPETIRHYEKKGVLKPDRQEGNQYRRFSMEDVCAIHRVRSFLHYGFTMDEARQLSEASNIEATELGLMTKAFELERHISEEMAMLNNIHQRLLYIQTVLANVGHFRQTESPAFYLIQSFDGKGELSAENQEKALSWAGNQYFTYPYARLDRESFFDELTFMSSMGISITEKELMESQKKIPGEAVYVPAQKCVYTSVIYREGGDAKEMIRPIQEHMAKHRLRLANDVIMRTIVSQKEEKRLVYYMDIWAPVE